MTGTPDIMALLARKGSGRKKGKKGRKLGRSKRHPAAQRYLSEKRWLRNKPIRMLRHIQRCPADLQARGLYQSLTGKPCAIPMPEAA